MHESENEHVIAITHAGLQVQSCMNERLYIMSWIFFQGLREGLGKLGSEWHPSCALGPSDTASNLRRIHSLRGWQHGDGLHHDVTSSRAPLFYLHQYTQNKNRNVLPHHQTTVAKQPVSILRVSCPCKKSGRWMRLEDAKLPPLLFQILISPPV